MKTKSKSLFIAVAAFAVTASGVHAFSSPELLIKAGLTDEQVIAVQEAQELKAAGEVVAAKQTLQAAGITSETMRQIREVAREAKQAVKDAVQAGDYDAFRVAIVDSPLEELITNEADFNQFVAAHQLRHLGDKAGASEIFNDLGVVEPGHPRGMHGARGWHKLPVREQLTDQQREALQAAHQANDKEAVRAIFAEAGIVLSKRGR